jgi:hypothetical protein
MFMRVKHYLAFFFSRWWRPLIVVGIGFFLFVIGGMARSGFWEISSRYLFGFTLLFLLASLVYQIVKKDKDAAVYTALSFLAVLVLLFFYAIFVLITG